MPAFPTVGRYSLRRLLLAITLLPFAAFAAPNFEEGEWEYEIKMTMDGKPMPMPGMKYSQCVTQKDFVPQRPEQAQNNCKLVSQQVSGNSVSWVARCTQGDMTMEGEGNVTYRTNTMQGTIKNTMKSAAKSSHTSVSQISGKRVGPCKSDKPR